MAETDSTPAGRSCTKCGEFKPLHDFCRATRGKYGRSARCRKCAQAYCVENKDRINALSLARYHRLREPERVSKAEAAEAKRSLPEKRCSKCKQVKKKECFGIERGRLDGRRPYCRDCHRAVNRASIESRGRSRKSDTWKDRFPDRAKEIARRHRSKIHNRIHHSISARIYYRLRGKGDSRTLDLLGYGMPELMKHLEKQFLTGMSWANYGQWHVDHIIPLSSFPIESPDDPELRRAWGLPNLRPLWATENIRKNAKRITMV